MKKLFSAALLLWAAAAQAHEGGIATGKALRVNASVHAPLLCIVDVFKVASGKLSLPGKVNQ
jgi:hypothetical protein